MCTLKRLFLLTFKGIQATSWSAEESGIKITLTKLVNHP